MWEITENSGSSIPLLPDDMYDAVCVQVIDLGTQKIEYQGQTKMSRKALFSWVVDGQTVEIDGKRKPRMVSKEYTLSLSERANLRKDLEGWRGSKFTDVAKFDISKVIGTSCRLLVGTTGTGRSNKVEAVKKAIKQVAVPAGVEKILFRLEDWKGGELPPIPNWIIERIKLSPEYKRATQYVDEPGDIEVSVGAVDDDGEENLPF